MFRLDLTRIGRLGAKRLCHVKSPSINLHSTERERDPQLEAANSRVVEHRLRSHHATV